MFNFCLDLGGTGSRGTLFDRQKNVLASGEADAGALSLGVDISEAAIRDIWRHISEQLPEPAPQNLVKVTIGAAGKGLPGRAKELEARLTDFQSAHVVSDGYGALLAATNGQSGALIAIGTGIAAINLTDSGTVTSLSGWGFPAGDLGSGAWIGFEFFREALVALDGSIPRAPIQSETLSQFVSRCGPEVRDLMRWHTSAKPKDFASLTPFVLECADAGDQFCETLKVQAAAEVVRVARALRVPEKPIHIAGGLGKTLLPLLVENGPDIDWKPCTTKAVDGLHLLALGQAPDEILATRPGMSALPAVETVTGAMQ